VAAVCFTVIAEFGVEEGDGGGGSALVTDMVMSRSGRRREESIRGVSCSFRNSIAPVLPVALSSFQVALRRARRASRYQNVSRVVRSVSKELGADDETMNWRLVAVFREGIGACGFGR